MAEELYRIYKRRSSTTPVHVRFKYYLKYGLKNKYIWQSRDEAKYDYKLVEVPLEEALALIEDFTKKLGRGWEFYYIKK